MDIFDDFLTPQEIEKRWGINAGTVRKLISLGDFSPGEYKKVGPTNLILRSAVEKRWGPETAPRRRKPGPKRKSPQG